MQPFTILLPVYNEEGLLVANTGALLRFLDVLGAPYEVLIGSNGSTDETARLGAELEQRYPQVRFFHLPRRGAGLAFSRAVDVMRHDRLVCLDMDLSVELSFVPEALAALETCDVVIGSKKMGAESRSPVRRLASDLFILCSKALLGLPFEDYSIGAKVYRKSVLERYRSAIGRGTFYVQQIVSFASRDGLKVTEIPARCQDFRRSRFNLIHEGLYRFACLFRLWLSLRLPGTRAETATELSTRP